MARWLPGAQRSAPTGARSRSSPPPSPTSPAPARPLPVQPVSGAQGNEAFGAVFAGGRGEPPIFKEPQAYEQAQPMVGASISADGTTVAWMGDDIAEQALTLPAEALLAPYSEPLWRRVADGPGAPIRRVTGGGGPRQSRVRRKPRARASLDSVAIGPVPGTVQRLSGRPHGRDLRRQHRRR